LDEDNAFEAWAAARQPPPGLALGSHRSLAPYLRRYVWRPIRRRGFDAAMWLVGEYQSGISDAFDVRVSEIPLPVPGLDPRLDGLTILHLSDLHLGTLAGLPEVLEEVLTGLKVDVFVLTGDYAPSYTAAPQTVYAKLRRIVQKVQARHGTYAILGNYDSAGLARLIRADDACHLLINQQVHLMINGAPLSITGTDDPYDQQPGPIGEALSQIGPGYNLALVHTPDLAAAAAAAGHDLYLCGHTHAGQICLPGGKAIFTNCKQRPDLAAGLWREKNMWGYTTRGAGVSGIARRLNCPPEAALFRLVAGVPLTPETL
jgi:predicted MPP superfamily phosphohydrolase